MCETAILIGIAILVILVAGRTFPNAMPYWHPADAALLCSARFPSIIQTDLRGERPFAPTQMTPLLKWRPYSNDAPTQMTLLLKWRPYSNDAPTQMTQSGLTPHTKMLGIASLTLPLCPFNVSFCPRATWLKSDSSLNLAFWLSNICTLTCL